MKRSFRSLLAFLCIASSVVSPDILVAQDDVRITEFMAANSRTFQDEDGEFADWIEIHNAGTNTVNLENWSLSDARGSLQKWRFPATNLVAGQYLVIFATEKNRRVPGAPLHTNFRLSGSGEYLGLVKPDGETIASQFSPTYPQQFSDVSFGLPLAATEFVLIETNAGVRYVVPTSGALGTLWSGRSFNDSEWQAGVNGIGYDTGEIVPGEDLATTTILAQAPPIYFRMNEPSGSTVATNSGTGGNGTYSGVALGVAGLQPPSFGGYEPNNTAGQFSTSVLSAGTPLLSGVGAFTMAGWIRPTATQAARTGLFGQNDAVEFGFIDAAQLQVWTPNGGSLNVPWTLGLNNWVHVAVVGDGASLKVYLNGTQAGSGGGSTSNYGTSTYNVNIGGGGIFDTTGNSFVGQIDEVAVWTRALSAEDILQQYQASIAPTAGAGYTNLIATDVQSSMLGVNSSAYLRYSFDVADPSVLDRLLLRLRFDDGFVAYLNGEQVASFNAPQDPAWDAVATAANSDGSAINFREFNVSGDVGFLQPGHNVLAIHALNTSRTNADFLLQAQLVGMTLSEYATNMADARYFTVPSPGDHNGRGTANLGPLLYAAAHTPAPPARPDDDDDINVTIRVEPTFAPVTSVVMNWRVMYGPTNTVTMLDDGLHGDGAANDGQYGATIPADASTNGQMVRWFFRATDAQNRVSRWPLFEVQDNAAEYLGTVVSNPNVTSTLPIVEIFLPAASVPTGTGTGATGIDGESGGRASLFFEGEFYDNIYIERRGNTTAAYNKKNHRVEFNPDKPFKHPGPGGSILRTSFMAEQADPSYLRQHLSFWLMDKMGVPAPFDYPVRLQTNGVFYQLAFHNDVLHAEQVERLGYNPGGALYKAAGQVEPGYSSTGGFEKKTRLWENRADYDALAYGINEARTLDQRRAFVFDNLNVPEIVNYMSVARWVIEGDDVWANMSLYRDTLGNREWSIIPFDMNVSWGQLYCGDDTTNLRFIISNNDNQKAHPLYGGSQVVQSGRPYNRMYDVIVALPETRQMLLRRMRTLMDKFILPPGTPFGEGIIEQHIAGITNAFWQEANFLDRQKWGWPCNTFGTACGMYCWGNNQWMTNGVADIINQFLVPRRIHWYATHSITNTAKAIGVGNAFNAGIPLSQPANAFLKVFSVEPSPASGNQAQEFLSLTNPAPFALDISDWRLEGAVQYKFQPGTIIPSNSVLYVSPDVNAFRARTTGPRGGMGLFVQGGYRGQLSARGETITIRDDRGRVVATNAYPGTPSLAQQFLRISEIMFFPSTNGVVFPSENYEYIELINTGSQDLDLTGVYFTNAISFTFTGSGVTTLGPGQRVLVVRNLAGFTERYGSRTNIAGIYSGFLDNQGERVTLVDARGEEILDFSYRDTWAPLSDGFGFSLVATNLTAPPDAWNDRSTWTQSSTLNGSPGVVDPAPQPLPQIQISEALTRTDVPPPTDSIELHNPSGSTVDISGWFLSDDFNTPKKFRIPNGTSLDAGGYKVFTEADFNPNPGVPPSFALSSTGDEVHLFSADAAGNLTGYYVGYSFGAAENGVTFGRHVISTGDDHFVAQESATLGSVNAGPKVGPIVITEIMYRPTDIGAGDDDLNEYIEIQNISAAPVPLYDPAAPTNTWKLTGGADLVFPANLTLGAGEYLLLVNIDPSNTNAADAFRARYGVPANVRLLGPYDQRLSNSGEDVELKKPILGPTNNVALYVMADQVEYKDSSPWPAGADGSGLALQRRATTLYGNDPANWVAAPPTPGAALPSPGTAPTISSHPQSQNVLGGTPVTFAVTASPAGVLYQWQFNGANLLGATNPTLVLNNVQLDQIGDYAVVVYNASSSVKSSNATLMVQAPVAILAHPQGARVKPGATVAFSVIAYSPSPLTYQWRRDGTPIADATNTSLTLTNVQLAQMGIYDVALTDDTGTITTDPAELVVQIEPVVTLAPQSTIVTMGDTLRLTAAVTNTATLPLHFRWRRGTGYLTTNIVYTYEDTLELPNASPVHGSNYTLTVANEARMGGTPLTPNAYVVVVDPPQNAIAEPGTAAQFAATTYSRPHRFEYQWQFNGTDIQGATNRTLDIPSVAEANYGTYRLSITAYTNVGTTPIVMGPAYYTATLSKAGQGTLRIEEPIFTGTNVVLRFEAIANTTYSLLYQDVLNPTSSWTRLENISSAATNRTVQVLDRGPLPPRRFYRLVTPAQ